MADTKVYLSGERIQGRSDDASGTFVSGLGSAADGTTSGATATTGVLGNCLNFDGSDDYVSLGTDSGLNLLNGGTIAMWINTDDMTNLRFFGMGTNKLELLSEDVTNFIKFRVSDGTVKNAVGDIAVPDSTWTHVAGTYDKDEGEIKLYVNGVLDATTTGVGQILTVTTAAYLGRNEGGQYYDGRIDDVGIWNRVLTLTEINKLYNNNTSGTAGTNAQLVSTIPTGLLAYYSCNSTTMTNVAVAVDESKTAITNVPAGTRYEETDTRKIFRRTVAVVGDETTVSSLTDVVFDTATKIGTLTYSGNEITLSGSTSFVHSINGSEYFQNSGTQTLECVAQKTGTSAWIVFGLAVNKVTSSSDHSADLEYGIKSADDGRTWYKQSSGGWTQYMAGTSDNVTFKIVNDRQGTVTYYADGSSIGSTTHGTPAAAYYSQATVAQTGTAGSYVFDYSGDVIITVGANAWVEKGTA